MKEKDDEETQTEMMQKKMDLHQLPSEILQRCILSYLTKKEQYVFLSLCKAWQSWLKEARTILITSISQSLWQNSTKSGMKYYQHDKLWKVFCDYEDYRERILHIAGCYSESSTYRRKLRLKIGMEDLLIQQELLMQYAECFYCMEFVESDSDLYFGLLLPIVIYSPTAESIQTWLRSRHVQWPVHNLSEVHGYLLQENELALEVDPADQSLTSLRGIHSLILQSDFLRFVELNLSNTLTSPLQVVVIEDCSHIVNLELLRGIPEVKLIGCNDIIDILALSAAKSVTIRVCEGVVDVSPLASVAEVTLEELFGLEDVSMLGNVKKLTLRSCKIDHYPVPAKGVRGQEWELSSLAIDNLVGYDNLLRLTLSDCHAVTDISMLGNVRYLTIDNCDSISPDHFPTPCGYLQEWHFIQMYNLDLKQFSGLNKLTLENCTFCEDEVCGMHSIQTVHITQGFHLRTIRDIANIRTLHIENCAKFETMANITNVQSINIKFCTRLDGSKIALNEDANVKYFSVSRCHNFFVGYFLDHIWTTLQSVEFVDCSALRVIVMKDGRCLDRIPEVTVERCPYFESPLSHNSTAIGQNKEATALITGLTAMDKQLEGRSRFKFDNFSLRVAIEAWCLLKSRTMLTYGDIGSWDVSGVTDMSYLLWEKCAFNEDISSWDVSHVQDMSFLFGRARVFNQPLNSWDVSSVEKMHGMFASAAAFNQPLDSWKVNRVVDISAMFEEASNFNQDVSAWETSSLQKLDNIFHSAYSFNQPLDSWDVSRVRDMSRVFFHATSFNQSLQNWDVSSVENMTGMFHGASAFNQPLNMWRVGNVRQMTDMFRGATLFNQSLISWDTSNVIDMSFMFYLCPSSDSNRYIGHG